MCEFDGQLGDKMCVYQCVACAGSKIFSTRVKRSSHDIVNCWLMIGLVVAKIVVAELIYMLVNYVRS